MTIEESPKPSSAPGLFAGGGETGLLMQAIDWSKTPLGPVERWPQALKTAIRIVLTSRQAMFVWWGDEMINLYNDAYRSILGGKHPWALGRPAAEVWREIWQQVEPRARSAMYENAGTYDESLPLIMERNGYPEETYYTFSYSPVPNDEGGTGGIFCANTDNTRQIVGERQIALLQELAARTGETRTTGEACSVSAECLETNPRDIPFALIYVADAEHRILHLCGVAGAANANRLPPEAAPRTVSLDWSGDGNGHAWPFHEVLRKKSPVMVDISEWEGLPAGAWDKPPASAVVLPIAPAGQTGRSGVLIAGLNPFRLYDDSYEGFMGVVANQISAAIANAQAYDEEKKRAEALAELDRAKTTFFSNVSHEFRTPLMLMLGPVEESLTDDRQPLPREQRDRMELVQRNSLRLLKLVNTLLDFARIEAGRVQANFERTDLAAFTADLAGVFRSAIERAGLELAIDCRATSAPVFVDRDMWEKIVFNLLSNAFKFTFEGRISVSLEEHDGKARLCVSDTGTGIAEEQIGRIFERFHRVEGALGRTHEGTGIGLALVQELTRLHGGEVRVESTPGVGSTFFVEIPLGGSPAADCSQDGKLRLEERGGEDSSPMSTALCAEAYIEEALRWLPTGSEEAASAALEPAVQTGLQNAWNGKREDRKASAGRVLLADDNADIRGYVSRLLGDDYEVETASNGQVALERIRKHRPDLVLSDVMMPLLDGVGLLRAIREQPELATLPVILISARAGEEATLEGLSEGADDYLVKPFTARELKARVASTLKLSRTRTEALAREQVLRSAAQAAEAKLVEVLESITDGFASLDQDWRYVYVNRVAANMVGMPAADLLGKVVWDIFPDLVGTKLEKELQRVPRDGVAVHFEYYLEAFDQWLEYRAYPTGDGVSIFVENIKEKKRLEEQLRQSAKLESVGVLAGGVAHDFNNLLVGIMGNASLALELLPQDHTVVPMIHEALRASERAADLTKQLLAYSGKGRFIVEPVNLTELVKENLTLLRTSISRNVQLELELETETLPLVEADRAQMQQVVMNLLINAAEAIGTAPGRITVRTRTERVEEPTVKSDEALAPGVYVCLEVADNGCGMDAETQKRIFDPFFTTKFTGRGLGLSAVLGIVRSHLGSISVASQQGVGTRFRLLLPAANTPAHPQRKANDQKLRTGSGTVLVVDDEETVRSTATAALRNSGYQVLLAKDGVEALELFEKHGDSISMVLLDVTMPVMTGDQALPLLKQLRPETRVVLTSGFSEADIVARFSGKAADGFLEKPFTAMRLIEKVGEILEVQAMEKLRHQE